MAPFKDEIGLPSVERLARVLAEGDPSFPVEAFVDTATAGLDGLELKARIARVAAALVPCLPPSFPDAAALVASTVGRSQLGMWEVWPVTDWVAAAGRGHPRDALGLLAVLTSRASGEIAIRTFLRDDPAGTMRVLRRWTGHRDEHVRRLVSEGTRPRLPWAPRVPWLDEQPGWALPLLERLHDDPSAYVRLSVANHLNDLTKLDPELAVEVAARWRDGGPHAPRLVAHGLRTLVKRGDPRALALVGADPDAAVTVEDVEVVTPRVVVGEALRFRVRVRSDHPEPARVVVDYAIDFVGAAGRRNRKVFKLRTFTLQPGEARLLEKAHRLAPVTIRTYRPGRHAVEVVCNGRAAGAVDFELVVG